MMVQGPDLGAILLALHNLMAGERHPNAHILGIQRGIARRFVRALSRAVPVRGCASSASVSALSAAVRVSLRYTAPMAS
jgi:hypothetical protein